MLSPSWQTIGASARKYSFPSVQPRPMPVIIIVVVILSLKSVATLGSLTCVMLGVTRCPHVVEGSQLLLLLLGDSCSGPSFPLDGLHSPEDTEHDVVLHHVKVPSYHRPFVSILNQHFVHLQKLVVDIFCQNIDTKLL